MQPHLLLHRFIRSRPHLSLAIALGIFVGMLLPDSMPLITRLLIAWNAAVWPYLVAMAWVMMRADYKKVRDIADRQDESAGLVLAALSVAAAMSLTAIVVELSQSSKLPTRDHAFQYGLTGLTIFGSWFLLGTLFCFHYAHLYYRAPANAAPLQFPGPAKNPDYWDFLYFSYTIAVAVQTSDVAIHGRGVRKLALGQSVLMFFFNLVILGLSINIAAGLMNH
jgi:uncharacterized membrane protein